MSSSTPKTHHHPSRSSEWTDEMRDKQARGKNPHSESEASDTEPMRLGSRGDKNESHLERERRGEAMYVLDNPVALMAHAQASGDSIAGQRLRFMRQLCGFDDKHDDVTSSTGSARSKQSRRVSDRVSR
ncbi:hypothetical protein F53441_12886 [Fusarium austroafricanum]|uniref:Uncharacterized protein n=1 Tax=Fusarium austroafricanum TaxID=2364996 RepID=A0A8H4JUK1_9HYPO|nr:hypothetical protein F53441_12886 [Fusarium austroafricanum]